MLSPYSTVVEKLHHNLDKEKVTMLKIERAGDVLADAVSQKLPFQHYQIDLIYEGFPVCWETLDGWYFFQYNRIPS